MLFKRLKSFITSALPFLVHTTAEPKHRSKYFIAVKKNDSNALDTLDTFVPFLPPRDRLYADPMLFKHAGTNYVFFEDYDYKKGTIAYVTVGDDMTISNPVEVLELSCHLSF